MNIGLAILLLKNIFGLFWVCEIELLWTFVFRSSWWQMLSLLWGKYLGVEWLDQRVVVVVQLLNLVRLFAALWTVAHQAPLSMGLSRQEYWSGLPFPPPGDLPNLGIKPKSLALQADSLPSEPPGKPQIPDQRVGVRNFHAFFFFQSGAILYSLHQKPPEFWRLTTLCASELFYFGPASWEMWFLIVVLSHLSLTISDVEHLFICCLAMQIPSFVRCLLKPFTIIPLPTPPPHWEPAILTTQPAGKSPFTDLIALSSYYWIRRVLYVFQIQVFCQFIFWTFGLILWLAYSSTCDIGWAENFSLG